MYRASGQSYAMASGLSLKGIALGVVGVVIVVNVFGAAMEPYLGLIGKTITIAVVAVVSIGALAIVLNLLDRMGWLNWIAAIFRR